LARAHIPTLVDRSGEPPFVNSSPPLSPGPALRTLRPPQHAAAEDAHKTVLEDEERLRLAEAAGQIGTWEWDPESGRQILSLELCRIFGVEVDDPERARKWAAHIWPEDWPKVQLLMQQATQTGRMEFEYRYLHPEQGLRWLYCRGCRFRNESRMFGIVQDVTSRKASEEASQRLAAIVESSDDAIISKDLHGVVTSWNPGAESIFGFTAQEMIGRPITTIIPPELRDDESRILATIARGERIEHFETVRLRKDGTTVEVSLTVSPVKDEAGRIVGAAKIARDITQRRKAEQTLLITERLAAVGRLAATVAHEINNPLEAVTNLVYLAKMAAASNEVLSFLTAAEEQLACVSHITKQTLGFYRETGGTRRVRPREIVSSVLSVFAPRARNKGIELTTEIESDVEISAVPGEIRQVVANLVSNSIDATPRLGKIRIRVSAARRPAGDRASGARITVADTGSGIPAEMFARVFEPFFTTKRDVGTGLGLWVCKNIVGAHHGSVRGRSSTARGKSGTVFSVFLPRNFGDDAASNERTQPGELLLKAS
jgi:PAS domain S-box-containing protein